MFTLPVEKMGVLKLKLKLKQKYLSNRIKKKIIKFVIIGYYKKVVVSYQIIVVNCFYYEIILLALSI